MLVTRDPCSCTNIWIEINSTDANMLPSQWKLMTHQDERFQLQHWQVHPLEPSWRLVLLPMTLHWQLERSQLAIRQSTLHGENCSFQGHHHCLRPPLFELGESNRNQIRFFGFDSIVLNWQSIFLFIKKHYIVKWVTADGSITITINARESCRANSSSINRKI
jgi:hypothetical protein